MVSKKIILLAFALLLNLGFLVFAHNADAASLSVVSTSGTYEVGDTVTVVLRVSSDVSINAVSASIKYPTDKLEVTSLSKSGSIINLWAQDPSFSNANGEVDLQGIVLNPGFSGTDGTVLILKMKPIAVGNADLIVSQASVLANDGKGTNVLTSVHNGSLTIVPGNPVQSPSLKTEMATTTATTSTPILCATSSVPVAPSQDGTTKSLLEALIYLVFILILIIAYEAHLLHKLHKIEHHRHTKGM